MGKAKVTCCTTLLRLITFIINGAIFLAGGALLVAGVWVKVNRDSLQVLLETLATPYLLDELVIFSSAFIGVGTALMFFAILGSCGTYYENQCVLLMFFFGLVIILVGECLGAILLFSFPEDVEEVLLSQENQITETIRNEYGRNNNLTSLWDTAMKELECCGFKNYTDFVGSQFVTENGIFPSKCCRSSGRPCNENAAYHAKIEGCFVALLEATEENSDVIAGVGLGAVVFEIAAVVLVMIFFCKAGELKKLFKSCKKCCSIYDYCKAGCDCFRCLYKLNKTEKHKSDNPNVKQPQE